MTLNDSEPPVTLNDSEPPVTLNDSEPPVTRDDGKLSENLRLNLSAPVFIEFLKINNIDQH